MQPECPTARQPVVASVLDRSLGRCWHRDSPPDPANVNGAIKDMGTFRPMIHRCAGMVDPPPGHVRKTMAGTAETAYFERSSTARPLASGGVSSSKSIMAPVSRIRSRPAPWRLAPLSHGCDGHMTLDDLAAMVEDGEHFVVHEAKTGEDMTSTTLRQIISQRATHG